MELKFVIFLHRSKKRYNVRRLSRKTTKEILLGETKAWRPSLSRETWLPNAVVCLHSPPRLKMVPAENAVLNCAEGKLSGAFERRATRFLACVKWCK